MKPLRMHRPGLPVSQEPPSGLVALVDAFSDPHVSQHGLTTTPDGRWALSVSVPADANVPIASVEKDAGGFPVVYQAAPAEPVRAGPAYPDERLRRG